MSLFSFGIRQKMLIILITVLIVSISVIGWFTLQKQEKDIYDATHQRGEEVVKHASHSIALYVVSYDYHSIQILLDEIITSPDIVRASVKSRKGNIMAEAGPPEYYGENRPVFSRDIMFDEKNVGKLTVELDTKDIVRRVEESRSDLMKRELALIIVVAIGEFIGLSFFIARPVSIISSSLEKSVDKNGRIKQEIPIQSKDEFGVLAKQFNIMREQLNTAHAKLHSRIEAADARLIDTNKALLEQSEQLQQMNEQLTLLSITDALTGLSNRRHFEEVVQVELKASERHGDPVSLLILDIDFFKKINDDYGHAAGDIALRNLAKILTENVRSIDIPCRIGGEEFAVACRKTGIKEAKLLAEKLRHAIENQTIDVGTAQISLTTSIGVDTIADPARGYSFDSHFQCADAALYYSKDNGRNKVTHFADLPKT